MGGAGDETRVEVGALILFTDRLEAMKAFYAALGVPLERERHGDGPVHWTAALGPVHFAVFEARDGDAAGAAAGARGAPRPRAGGTTMPGFAVPSLERAFAAVTALGARVVQEPREAPWGPRALVLDPDGRLVEVFARRR